MAGMAHVVSVLLQLLFFFFATQHSTGFRARYSDCQILTPTILMLGDLEASYLTSLNLS